LTLGDPVGIGPEIVAAAVARAAPDRRRRLRVYGGAAVFDRAWRAVAPGSPPDVEVIDCGELDPAEARFGRPTPATGAAQVATLEAAIAAARAGEVAALVTAPIHKQSARLGGLEGVGHTELLARRFDAPDVAMMFAGPRIKAVLATIHIPLAEVPGALSVERIVRVATLGLESLERDFALPRPRLGVLGLNPHAGESGLLGGDEERVIAPAVARLRDELGDRATIEGPLVPDVAFRLPFDLFVAMYHDQALIPVKLLEFDATVNVTLGLPIVRTSPDHGVAHDIAGQGMARPDSFIAALDLAEAMLARRAERHD
jgi:4-hydroxythreonine-4-phosphate dehydrogenase